VLWSRSVGTHVARSGRRRGGQPRTSGTRRPRPPDPGVARDRAQIAGPKQATPAQIALAWLLAQQPWIVPIPGTRRLGRLQENLGAAAVELTDDDLREIDDATARIEIEGARYPEHLERLVDR
jgi:aryl-alcohol dehydrogenase-like predicted oxidoreductase